MSFVALCQGDTEWGWYPSKWAPRPSPWGWRNICQNNEEQPFFQNSRGINPPAQSESPLKRAVYSCILNKGANFLSKRRGSNALLWRGINTLSRVTHWIAPARVCCRRNQVGTIIHPSGTSVVPLLVPQEQVRINSLSLSFHCQVPC